MIRKLQARIFLLFFFVLLVQSSKFGQLEITRVTRHINLASGYATQIAKISFVSNEEANGHFSYLIPLQFDSKVSKIWFSKSEKDRSSLHYQQQTLSYGGITYSQYKVKLPHNYNIGDIGDLYVHIVYLYRYINLPESITLTEDQKVQYEDTKYIVSPYHILEHDITYKMTKIFEIDQDGQKKSISEVTFSKSSIEPFTFVRHRVFGVNNNPLVQFTSVQKVIEVSHWGNVGVSEHYSIINKGPSLKGQFSRVTYGSRGDSVKNAFRGIDFDLPYEIWGLYYLDQVGNITTSRAWRDDHKNVVHVTINPRFSLLGGWKSNWQLGYNFNTLGHLFHTGNRFELKNIKLEYALQKVQTQHYKIKIILPEGAHNVRIKIGGKVIDNSLIQISTSEGYLDFNGRPTYTILNYLGVFTGKNIEVEYDFDQSKVYQKILILFVIILAFLGAAIFLKRFRLQAFGALKQD